MAAMRQWLAILCRLVWTAGLVLGLSAFATVPADGPETSAVTAQTEAKPARKSFLSRPKPRRSTLRFTILTGTWLPSWRASTGPVC